jgi:hypothetical protein
VLQGKSRVGYVTKRIDETDIGLAKLTILLRLGDLTFRRTPDPSSDTQR